MTVKHKERLTVQWFTDTMGEIRQELSELQQSTSNISRDLQQKNQFYEDINQLRVDFKTIKLEIEALKSRQETTEFIVKELRDEALEQSNQIRRNTREREVSEYLKIFNRYEYII